MKKPPLTSRNAESRRFFRSRPYPALPSRIRSSLHNA
jgi:hypothetical protein